MPPASSLSNNISLSLAFTRNARERARTDGEWERSLWRRYAFRETAFQLSRAVDYLALNVFSHHERIKRLADGVLIKREPRDPTATAGSTVIKFSFINSWAHRVGKRPSQGISRSDVGPESHDQQLKWPARQSLPIISRRGGGARCFEEPSRCLWSNWKKTTSRAENSRKNLLLKHRASCVYEMEVGARTN